MAEALEENWEEALEAAEMTAAGLRMVMAMDASVAAVLAYSDLRGLVGEFREKRRAAG